jgi:hypothetical protein
MQESSIAEVRGIAVDQNLDPYIAGVVQEKMKGFPDGASYEKKAADMKLLTAVENKFKEGQELSKDDLTFIYEINAPIEGFGSQRDPRIAELRSVRNPEQDMPVVFGCSKEQIAHVPHEIDGHTKAYVGALEPGIFQALPENLEHVYTSFPKKKICMENLEIGGKTAEQLFTELKYANINISEYAEYMLKSQDFVPGKKAEAFMLIRLTVADLGFSRNATTDQIYERAQALGLELCPSDVGPEYRLKYQNQPTNEWLYIGMKQITDWGTDPHVFALVRFDVGLWLDNYWAEPVGEWRPYNEFVFCLRKLKT